MEQARTEKMEFFSQDFKIIIGNYRAIMEQAVTLQTRQLNLRITLLQMLKENNSSFCVKFF
jgi:hypothetical protein